MQRKNFVKAINILRFAGTVVLFNTKICKKRRAEEKYEYISRDFQDCYTSSREVTVFLFGTIWNAAAMKKRRG